MVVHSTAVTVEEGDEYAGTHTSNLQDVRLRYYAVLRNGSKGNDATSLLRRCATQNLEGFLTV